MGTVAKLWKDPKCPTIGKWLNDLCPSVCPSTQWNDMQPFKMMLVGFWLPWKHNNHGNSVSSGPVTGQRQSDAHMRDEKVAAQEGGEPELTSSRGLFIMINYITVTIFCRMKKQKYRK